MNRPARAVALGAVQGLTEALPVSSSLHTGIACRLAFPDAQPREVDVLEAALHAASGLALLPRYLRLRRRLPGRFLVAGLVPPLLCGYLLESARAGRPARPGLLGPALGGAVALAGLASKPGWRGAEQAGAGDGLAFGVAQSLALYSGVSRSGATLAAARVLRFDQTAAEELSFGVGLPILFGAAALRLASGWRWGLAPAGQVLAFSSLAAWATTGLGYRVGLPRLGRSHHSAFALYRTALAAVGLARSRASSQSRAKSWP